VKKLTKKELEELYAEELKRKDEIIDKLREENELLLKSALQGSHRHAKASKR